MYGLMNRCKRLIDELEGLLFREEAVLERYEIRKGKLEFPCEISGIDDGYVPYENGTPWSGPEFDDYALFRFSLMLPTPGEDEDIYLRITSNYDAKHNMIRPQMLLLTDTGAVQGLDTNHKRVRVTKFADGSRKTFYVYAFSGIAEKSPFGDLVDMDPSIPVRMFVSVERKDRLLSEYYYDLKTAFVYLQHFTENSFEHQTMLHALNDSLACVDLRAPFSRAFRSSVEQGSQMLKNALYDRSWPNMGEATLVGHTHIDLAWLWRYSHTRDKVLRSFATELKLLEDYEDHIFMSSQAQLYEYVREQDPQMFSRIQQAAADGRWEPEGAMWVEPDMNLASGESIVRQILYGKQFFRDHFGVDCKVLWLPDVFGYSAALPQILKKSGVPYFMTSKIATNELNRFPVDTFYWKGIDGSTVLSHLTSYLPGAYNPNIHEGEILTGWQNYLQKNINQDILIPFGYADGGGGPTEAQVEEVLRLKNGLPGVPKVKLGKVRDYFERLEQKLDTQSGVPVWSGEIYYEKHRGTYTSMARVKRQNRKCELLYQNVEWLSVLADAVAKQPFPKAEFDRGMKKMLLNQFHDVLPGSSIQSVYEDSDRLYEETFRIGEDLCRQATDRILSPQEDAITVFNPHSWEVSGYVTHHGALRYVAHIPAKGAAILREKGTAPEIPVTVQGNRIENRYYVLMLAADGTIASLYDKQADRMCFRPGAGANRLRIFEDKPGMMNGWVQDNWDLDSYYRMREYEMPVPASMETIRDDGECAVIRTVRQYGDSRIQQDLVVYARSPRVDFVTEIDWKEHSQVLKAEFPVDVNAAKAAYEIQFGHLERDTACNTSWDEAKFEVCAYRWADISDGGYGMALMNDCKYGYSADGSTISLTLLRCGNRPNPQADKEFHRFTYSILPHQGSLQSTRIVREAALLNNPLFALDGASRLPGGDRFSLFACEGAILETVKPAEDGNGVILRLYEEKNTRSVVRITSDLPVLRAQLTDLMEQENGSTLEPVGNELRLTLAPFEIQTIRVWL